ncbi:hypothetical protein CNF02395 [Cryptococcus deneoformans JEC21]|uniref:Uncharacterized protein n=1 Tax=Cryptococcus deneoformans (strain JEC21 / ATCC MYA-565) TaxID=214684 RepID=A0A0S2M5B9_CRYD1|nr:hypothetical protein CNF02395 [Cryptococcus neoformans var. neoformans JEC21]ALO68990.1 hypothetical protein CNF02395 [Cryptococcus neoformans var. neoformans JEC21]
MSRSSSPDIEKGVPPPPRRSRGKCCCILFCVLLLLAALAVGGFALYEYVIKPRIIDTHLLSDIDGNGSTTASAPTLLQTTVIPTATSPSFNGAVGGYTPAIGVWSKADKDDLDGEGDGSGTVDQDVSNDGQSNNSAGIDDAIMAIDHTTSASASDPSSATKDSVTKDWDGYDSGQWNNDKWGWQNYGP